MELKQGKGNEISRQRSAAAPNPLAPSSIVLLNCRIARHCQSELPHVFVHRLDSAEGSEIKFDQVLLVDNDGKIKIGSPLISGAIVTAKVLSHLKGDKVLVFKKKRRKGYQKMNGHRQQLSKIEINSIKL